MNGMRVFAPRDPARNLKFHIGSGLSSSGARLGGRPPALEPAPQLDPAGQYVMTVPFLLDPLVYVSVFVNCSFDTLLDAQNEGLQADSRIVVVRHGETSRAPDAPNASELTAHPLLFETDPTPDLVDDGEGGQVIASSHKIGGRPHCIQEPELEGVEALLREGYVQAVQLDFPGSKDALVSGSWPFGDGLFNLFLRAEPTASVYWAVQG